MNKLVGALLGFWYTYKLTYEEWQLYHIDSLVNEHDIVFFYILADNLLFYKILRHFTVVSKYWKRQLIIEHVKI